MKNVKSLLALVLACMMIASMIVVPVSAADVDVWDGTADTTWYNADATTFTLTTAEQLAGLAQLVNGGNSFSGKTILLGADIYLNDVSNFANWSTTAPTNKWVPIGGYSSSLSKGFSGTFNGQGYTVTGMYVKAQTGHSYDRVGFFGQTAGVSISNVTFESCWAFGASSGIVIGWANGGMPSFNNVDIAGCVIAGNKNSVGFLLGQSGGGTFKAKNCDVSGTINGGSKVAGLLGNLQSGTIGLNVDNCNIDVTIAATGNNVGAVVGCLGYGSGTSRDVFVKNSTIKADITATRDFGAVIGYSVAKTLTNVVFENLAVEASMDVYGSPSSINYQGIAVLFGYAQSAITELNVKNVDVKGDMVVGQNSGIVLGRASGAIGTLNVENLTSNVEVITKKGTGDAQCNGGIVGLPQGVITRLNVDGFIANNTYRPIDSADANKSSDLGGVLGNGTATTLNVTNSIFNDTIVGRTSVGGVVGVTNSVTTNISNCIITSTVTGTDGVSAVVGNFRGETLNATNVVVDSILSGAQYVAGFVGDTNTDATKIAKCNFTFDGCLVGGTYTATTRNAGGFIGDYDTASGTSVAGATNNCGIFTFKNSIVEADIVAPTNAGGLIGRVYPPNGKLIVENVSLLGARTATTANPAVLVGTYGGANTLADLVTLKNLYFDNGAVVNFFGAEGTSGGANIYAEGNVTFTADKIADFEAVLAASEAWGKGTDGKYYPIGINYPGHEHVWGAWEINMEVEPMEKTHYCEITGCGAYETEVYLPETDACTCRDGGDWTAWRVQFEATCTKDGQAYRLCNECGAQETAILTAGHVWGGWKTEYCSAVATRTCTRCGEVEEKATTVNHNAVLWVVTKYASATEAGEEQKICRNCGEVFDTRTIPAYGVPAVPVTPGTTPVVPSVTPTYTDIAGHKYEADIVAVTKAGLFEGMGDNKFAPETTMTRAMIVTVLARLQNVDVSAYKNTFTDVAADSYYAPYVGWAEAAGITNGMGDGKFAPDEEITREQALTMIARYLKYAGEDMAGNKTGTFTDMNTASAWAADSVATLVKLGIVEFDSTTLRPTADATRAELANFFANLLEVLG